MRINSYFVNQYKDRDYIRYNQVKFKTICIVLDFFAFCGGANNEHVIARSDVEKKIYAAIRDTEFNRAAVNGALADMEIMGHIKEAGHDIHFLPNGLEAYKEQTFHQISASLTEAKQTRKLSVIAIVISVIALLMNLISQIISTFVIS